MVLSHVAFRLMPGVQLNLTCSSFHFPGSEGACQQLTFGASPGAASKASAQPSDHTFNRRSLMSRLDSKPQTCSISSHRGLAGERSRLMSAGGGCQVTKLGHDGVHPTAPGPVAGRKPCWRDFVLQYSCTEPQRPKSQLLSKRLESKWKVGTD